MQRALELAARGRGLVSPNPMVGAVVVPTAASWVRDGTKAPGRPHAEVLRASRGGRPRPRRHALLTLEPCDHHGSHPSVRRGRDRVAGVARVIAAAGDPNPIVDGSGFARSRAAGIEVAEGIWPRMPIASTRPSSARHDRAARS